MAATGDPVYRVTAHGSFLGDGLTILRGGSTLGSVSRQQETAINEIFRVFAASPEEAALVLARAMSLVESDPARGATPEARARRSAGHAARDRSTAAFAASWRPRRWRVPSRCGPPDGGTAGH